MPWLLLLCLSCIVAQPSSAYVEDYYCGEHNCYERKSRSAGGARGPPFRENEPMFTFLFLLLFLFFRGSRSPSARGSCVTRGEGSAGVGGGEGRCALTWPAEAAPVGTCGHLWAPVGTCGAKPLDASGGADSFPAGVGRGPGSVGMEAAEAEAWNSGAEGPGRSKPRGLRWLI